MVRAQHVTAGPVRTDLSVVRAHGAGETTIVRITGGLADDYPEAEAWIGGEHLVRAPDESREEFDARVDRAARGLRGGFVDNTNSRT
jgi:hypothetical protein